MIYVLIALWFQLVATQGLFSFDSASTQMPKTGIFSVAYDSTSQNVIYAGTISQSLDGRLYSGGGDALVFRLSPNGTRIWTLLFGDSAYQIIRNIAIDPLTGDVYCVGLTSGSIFGVSTQDSSYDLFLVKLRQNGTLVYARTFRSTGSDGTVTLRPEYGLGRILISGTIAANAAISVHSTLNGSMISSTYSFPANGRAYPVEPVQSEPDGYVVSGYATSFDGMTNAGLNDAFVSRINLNGSRKWSKMWGTSAFDIGWDMELDTAADIYYLTGYVSVTGTDFFLTAVLLNGTTLWYKQNGTADEDYGTSLTIHPPTGLLFVAGFSYSNFDGEVPKVSPSGFITVYAKNGTRILTHMIAYNVNTRFYQMAFSPAYDRIFLADILGSIVQASVLPLTISSPANITLAQPTIAALISTLIPSALNSLTPTRSLESPVLIFTSTYEVIDSGRTQTFNQITLASSAPILTAPPTLTNTLNPVETASPTSNYTGNFNLFVVYAVAGCLFVIILGLMVIICKKFASSRQHSASIDFNALKLQSQTRFSQRRDDTTEVNLDITTVLNEPTQIEFSRIGSQTQDDTNTRSARNALFDSGPKLIENVAQGNASPPKLVTIWNSAVTRIYNSGTPVADPTAYVTKIYSSGATVMETMVQGGELSIPAFLAVSPSDYKLGNRINKGASGAIHMAQIPPGPLAQKAGGNVLVAKVIKSSGDESRASFFQEIAIMYLLRDCEFIAKIVGFSEEPQTILMPFYQGGSLRTFLTKARPPQLLKLCLMRDVAEGIRHLHQNGIVHCDLKLDNILMDNSKESGRLSCRLTDFGISQILDGKAMPVKAFEIARIEGASRIYAAPEVLRMLRYVMTVFYEKMDPAVIPCRDIYALAIVIFEIETLQKPRLT